MDDNLKEFRKSTEKTFQKSQDDFEKQLSFISAGTLAVSMFLIEKVIEDLTAAHCKWVIIASWCLLGFTLVGNLFSHYLSTQFSYKNLKEIDNETYNQEKSTCRNTIIKRLNLATLITLFIGIVFLIIFLSINI